MLALLAPLFIFFELTQLIVAERYIGLRQIRANRHPLDENPGGPGKLLTGAWLACLILSWVYYLSLLVLPETRLNGLIILGMTAFGTLARRAMSIKWTLVLMTIEGATRIGLLAHVILDWYLRLA